MREFPPKHCIAWEDCNHDGVCHDFPDCGAIGPNHRMPDRITLSRVKGWRMPENTVKVDRSTIWGNPWTVEEFYNPGQNTLDDAQAEAVLRFRAALSGFDSNGTYCPPIAHPDSRIGRIIRLLPELRGKNLACWCKPGSPCHADVLLELANA